MIFTKKNAGEWVASKDGKVIAWYPTNEWNPEDVVATIRKNIA